MKKKQNLTFLHFALFQFFGVQRHLLRVADVPILGAPCSAPHIDILKNVWETDMGKNPSRPHARLTFVLEV